MNDPLTTGDPVSDDYMQQTVERRTGIDLGYGGEPCGDLPAGVDTAEALTQYARDMQSMAANTVPLEEYTEDDDWCNLHRLPFLYCCHLHHC